MIGHCSEGVTRDKGQRGRIAVGMEGQRQQIGTRQQGGLSGSREGHWAAGSALGLQICTGLWVGIGCSKKGGYGKLHAYYNVASLYTTYNRFDAEKHPQIIEKVKF